MGSLVAWWQYVALGATGGALVEALSIFRSVTMWQGSRRNPNNTLKKSPPKWNVYVDIALHLWLLALRVPLGAGVAALFGLTGQISGAYAAVAFGFAAPAVLEQLGGVPQIANAVAGTGPRDLVAASDESATVTPISRAE